LHFSYSPSHPPWLDHRNDIWWSVHVMKPLIMQCSPASRHFLPLRCKYSPQHPVDSCVDMKLNIFRQFWGMWKAYC
jgi:hypothetical protein